ncbi:MAG: glycosyltransferase, partial [Methanobacterium paludis]|nr:glycosyltransferase [Methanobacterium paludis]
MKFPTISIVILNWNNAEDTINCLESVYQLDYPNYNVILIDNDSKDDSLRKIKNYCMNNLKIRSKLSYGNDGKYKPITILEYAEEEINSKLKVETLAEETSLDKDLIIIKNKKNQ